MYSRVEYVKTVIDVQVHTLKLKTLFDKSSIIRFRKVSAINKVLS